MIAKTAQYRYSTGTEIREGDFVTITTGSPKDRTLRMDNGYVVGFGERDASSTCSFLEVTVQLPDGKELKAAPSRVALISR